MCYQGQLADLHKEEASKVITLIFFRYYCFKICVLTLQVTAEQGAGETT